MDKDLFLKWLKEKTEIIKEDISKREEYSDDRDCIMYNKGVVVILDEIINQVSSGKFDKKVSGLTIYDLVEDIRGILIGLDVFYTEKDENGISRMYEDVAKSKYAGGLSVAMGCALDLKKRLEKGGMENE